MNAWWQKDLAAQRAEASRIRSPASRRFDAPTSLSPRVGIAGVMFGGAAGVVAAERRIGADVRSMIESRILLLRLLSVLRTRELVVFVVAALCVVLTPAGTALAVGGLFRRVTTLPNANDVTTEPEDRPKYLANAHAGPSTLSFLDRSEAAKRMACARGPEPRLQQFSRNPPEGLVVDDAAIQPLHRGSLDGMQGGVVRSGSRTLLSLRRRPPSPPKESRE